MSILLLTAQLLVSLTLLISGCAKLGDRRGTQDAMTSLRLPLATVHGAVATILPAVEVVLALGVWLPVPVVPLVLASLTEALLLAYLVIIARALGFEEQVECSCFGSLGSPTVSRTTLARNSLLVALGVLAVIGAARAVPAHAVTSTPGMLVQLALAAVVACLLALLTLGGTRSSGRNAAGGPWRDETTADRDSVDERASAEDDEALDYMRTPIPFGMLRGSGDQPITLAALTAERAALLIWVRPGCGPCERVLNAVGGWRAALEETLSVRTLVRADPEELAPSVRERAGDSLARDIEGNLAASLGATSSPAAVLLGADGLLAGGPVLGAEDVTALVEEIIAQIERARANGEIATPPA